MTALIRSVAMVIALLLISFALPRALPGDPLAGVTGGQGADTPLTVTPEAHARLLAYYGLDRPLPAQLGHFLARTVQGDLGFSIAFAEPVSRLILNRLPWTLLLASLSLVVASVLGCLLGLLAAVRHTRRGPRRLGAALLLIGSLPDFVIGILVILALGVFVPLFPTAGASTAFQACPGALGMVACAGDVLAHSALPVLTLALAQLPAFFLLMRAAALGELGQAYIVAARARGLRDRTVAIRHVGRNAILPILTLLGLRLGTMLGGLVVVETLFAYPGLGHLMYEAAQARDYPVLQALFLIGGASIVLINALAEVARRRIDPRLRSEAA